MKARSEPRGDSWEGRLKEILGGVVNHTRLRQVNWNQGEEGCVHKNEYPLPNAVFCCLSAFTSPPVPPVLSPPPLSSGLADGSLIHKHFKLKVFKGNPEEACSILEFYVPEQNPQMCERSLGATLAIVKDVLPLDACFGTNMDWGGPYPPTHPLHRFLPPFVHHRI